jgi:hypothetical protein
LFRKGKVVKRVKEKEMLKALEEELRRL